MHIALTALGVRRQLFGGGTYVKNLVHTLARLAPEHHYTIYVTPENSAHFQDLGPHVQLIFAPRQRPLRLVWEQVWLPGELARRRVEVFHGTGFVSPRRRVCPQVTTIHDLTFFLLPGKHTFFKRHYFRRMIPLSAKASDLLIAVSESTKRDLVRLLGLDPEKVKVIHLGKDERFRSLADAELQERAKQQCGVPANKKVILFVGMIEPRKNLETLLGAFARLKSLHGDYCLVLAGAPGWGYRGVFERVRRLGLEGPVVFPGYVPEDLLPALYNAAELFVYPSLYEGFGLPVLEAMACGVPVITSNVSSLPEVAGDAAVLVDPRSEEELRQGILRLLEDGELRKQLREKGLARSRLFSWEKTARATLEVYQQLGG